MGGPSCCVTVVISHSPAGILLEFHEIKTRDGRCSNIFSAPPPPPPQPTPKKTAPNKQLVDDLVLFFCNCSAIFRASNPFPSKPEQSVSVSGPGQHHPEDHCCSKRRAGASQTRSLRVAQRKKNHPKRGVKKKKGTDKYRAPQEIRFAQLKPGLFHQK